MKKAKALIYRPTEEYGKYLGNGEFATCDIPHLHPLTFTLEGLSKHVEEYEGIILDTTGWYATVVSVDEVK